MRAGRIDIHAHFFPMLRRADVAWADWPQAPWLHIEPHGRSGHIMCGEQRFRPVDSALWDPQARLAMLDAQGVAMQLISATPVMWRHEGPLALCQAWARQMNEAALAFCAVAPQRFKALAQVPLQDGQAAAAELRWAISQGCVGVQIGNHLGQQDLDSPVMLGFLRHCAEQGVPVMVHPWEMMAPERMQGWMLPWLVGMPAETHLSLLRLILSGSFERLPNELKLCFAHGGGSFAALLGRADNAWHRRDIVRTDCPHPPSHYLQRFHVDSCVFDPRVLALLTAVMGPERIMLGSDQPFPLGEQRIGALLDDAPCLSDADRDAMLGGNARRFFGLA